MNQGRGKWSLTVARYIYMVVLIQFLVNVAVFEHEYEEKYWEAWATSLSFTFGDGIKKVLEL